MQSICPECGFVLKHTRPGSRVRCTKTGVWCDTLPLKPKDAVKVWMQKHDIKTDSENFLVYGKPIGTAVGNVMLLDDGLTAVSGVPEAIHGPWLDLDTGVSVTVSHGQLDTKAI